MTPSIVFFGTPDFAAQILEFLVQEGIVIKGVVTQPDRPKGRSLQMTFSPVKEIAIEKLKDIPIFQPEKCSNPEFLERIASLNADLYVVVAFGQILPVKLLQIPPLGCINVHASLLPKYRGAAPIQRAILNGDQETGVAIQKMVKELDAGDVIAEEKMEIGDRVFGELYQALCEISKPLLVSVIKKYSNGIPPALAQDGTKVTFAPKITPEEGEIHWEKRAVELHNLVRGYSPKPGAWCMVDWNGEKKRVKVLRSKVLDLSGTPGSILSLKEGVVACGQGSLQLLEIQPEGKPKMAAADWFRGARVPPAF